MDEIGNGIIPIEKSERIWREEAGKVGCYVTEFNGKNMAIIEEL